MTAAEKMEQHRVDSIEASKQKTAANLKKYLSTPFTARVDTVGVDLSNVLIKGNCPAAAGNYVLVEVTPDEDVTELTHFPYRTDLTDRSFSVTLPRKLTRAGLQYDRALSKWAIVKVKGDVDSLCSHVNQNSQISTHDSQLHNAEEYLNASGLTIGVYRLTMFKNWYVMHCRK